MKVEIEEEFLKINVSDLVSVMSDDAKKVFYQEIVFDETLLRACMDLLVSNGAFEDYYHSTTYGPTLSRLADRLREKCIPLMDEAAQTLIKNLTGDLKDANENYQKYRDHAWLLEREWPVIVYDPSTGEAIPQIKIKKCPQMEKR